MSKKQKSLNRFDSYKAKDGWRWRMKSKTGRILCDGSEAYSRKHDCMRAILRVVKIVRNGNWVQVDQ